MSADYPMPKTAHQNGAKTISHTPRKKGKILITYIYKITITEYIQYKTDINLRWGTKRKIFGVNP